MTDPLALAHASAAAMWAVDRASQGLGMCIEAVGPGHARLSMAVTERMVNGHGICHGGFIFALADSAFAFACNSHGERMVAQHCAITFLKPVHLGETLSAEAAERSRVGRSGIYDIRVSRQGNETVAEFRGHSRTTGERLVPEGSHAG